MVDLPTEEELREKEKKRVERGLLKEKERDVQTLYFFLRREN